ncbi:60S ribosomal export protein NMD3-like isoform X5 [Mercenaria mercenaria]|uniref:60S ribosomal export protein NMD3-like isoform X1 n=1 Tax=Mercenaria mercenaria TaxID=6596 RepID=UPI001E1E210A|nr:60S ribosomal export protein NMD3-like isoform X1 [Mercenaria mercenaria]XP_053382844.1 60S ribosomal export protein NMD3-like isoform X2 [Mercenaria mercenaria]XP_053382845.1 60S ribosomal export protein NMD3-like isoform X3 [Mercenaria mercenaria]XP_053382846.1 60S ribosomal export protein NMD3-like isoform X4 [Mercenaria mercenaria]XP_053382847.1 60S ribosomal export protein NMD3-like isoform X5 [Mercenaria mercenaria]
MDFLSQPQNQTVGLILCCQCGTQIEPNPTNMCVACLRSEVDITEGIPKQAVLYFCRKCERYQQPPDHWILAQLESRELLSICLKKIKGLNKVRLIDAGFVWTEPHSMRIKVKLTIQKEVMNGAVLQQVFVVEFTVTNHQCDDCHRVEAKDFWRAVVQIRQKTDHKKTFFYLEQLILKHKAHWNTVNIKPAHDGLDFFYTKKDDAKKMVEFLNAVVPCKHQMAQELISHDIRNNTFNYKHTFSVTIVPVCKDNIVCLPKKLAASLGNINPICVCYKVTQTVHLIDPNTLKVAEVSGQAYWRSPFVSLCSPKQLIEYMVMQVDIVLDKDKPVVQGQTSQRHVLADVWVSRMSDLGVNDQQYFCRTHIGHLLNAGDTVLGFDMLNANLNNEHIEKLKEEKLPDVVIVKKVYADKKKRNRRRKWKLQHLNDELHNLDSDSVMNEYTDFLEDLEEDPTIRQNVNIYKDKNRIPIDTDDTDEEGIPQISLQEMLDDLHIADDATGGEGAAMMD